MGNAISGNESNDALVNILLVEKYIKTKKVERVFRAVDRGDYVLDCDKNHAYNNGSSKAGIIHLSAACVYATALEGLALEAGLSFLNVGSGTGYFSTMAGLFLGHSGTNHGIELHKDCVEYAYERLAKFKQKSQALNEFDFCEPVFTSGNFLRVIPNREYDRVYCGAACPESHEAFIKQFVKVGGILVMPYKGQLVRIERVGTDTWKHEAMLSVVFTTLDIPEDEDQTIIQLPFSEALTLQDLCRCSIRSYLRKLIWQKHPELESKTPITSDPRSHPSGILMEEEENDDSSSPSRLVIRMNPYPSNPIHSTVHLFSSIVALNGRSPSDLEDSGIYEDVEPVMSKEIPIDSRPSSSFSSFPSALGDPLSSPNCPKNERKNGEDEPMLVDEPESSKTPNDEETTAFSNGNNVCHEPLITADYPQMSHARRLVGDGSANRLGDGSADGNQKTSPKLSECEDSSEEIYTLSMFETPKRSLAGSSDEDGEDSWNKRSKDPDDSPFDLERMNGNDGSSTQVRGSSDAPPKLFVHNVDVDNLAEEMKRTIQALPLPTSLQLYINYNRPL